MAKSRPASKDGKVRVRFVRDDTPFMKGEEYEFEPSQAEKLVERARVAEYAGR